jgi:hypothetical protein
MQKYGKILKNTEKGGTRFHFVRQWYKRVTAWLLSVGVHAFSYNKPMGLYNPSRCIVVNSIK